MSRQFTVTVSDAELDELYALAARACMAPITDESMVAICLGAGIEYERRPLSCYDDDPFEAERIEYEHDARTGKSSDWTTFDEDRSAELLFRLNQILRDRSRTPYVQALDCREAINELIEHCAKRHAEICRDNGRL